MQRVLAFQSGELGQLVLLQLLTPLARAHSGVTCSQMIHLFISKNTELSSSRHHHRHHHHRHRHRHHQASFHRPHLHRPCIRLLSPRLS